MFSGPTLMTQWLVFLWLHYNVSIGHAVFWILPGLYEWIILIVLVKSLFLVFEIIVDDAIFFISIIISCS